VRQLERFTGPKVVVLVNDGSAADRFDLQEALEGYLTYGGEKATTLPAGASKRMLMDRGKIDLYLWIDLNPEPEVDFVTTGFQGRALRSSYFRSPGER
jgi:hypothetical protein